MGAFLFWAQCRGIRTRKGAELRKREAFSSAAREERSDEAGRGRRQPHADIPHRPPLNWKRSSQGDRFCLRPVQRDSNPQGCGAEETRSVFQRSTRGAKRRSGARAAPAARGHPSSPTIELLGLRCWRPFFFVPGAWDSNPKDPLFQGPWSKNGKNEYCYFACNI